MDYKLDLNQNSTYWSLSHAPQLQKIIKIRS